MEKIVWKPGFLDQLCIFDVLVFDKAVAAFAFCWLGRLQAVPQDGHANEEIERSEVSLSANSLSPVLPSLYSTDWRGTARSLLTRGLKNLFSLLLLSDMTCVLSYTKECMCGQTTLRQAILFKSLKENDDMADPLDFLFTPKLKKVQKLFYSLKKTS